MKQLLWLVLSAGALGTMTHAPAASAQSGDDDEDQLLLDQAKRAIAKKDYGRAGKLLDKALGINPRRIDLYVLRASVYGIAKEYDDAIALLEKARGLAPNNVDVQAGLGRMLVLSGDATKGVPLLEAIVAKNPDRYAVQVVLGHQYEKTSKWTDAIAAFEAYFGARPAELAREDRLHRVSLANAYLRSGDAAAAKAAYEQVLEDKPNSELARLGLAWSTAAISCKQALPLFEDMADLEEKYPEVSLVRGRCAMVLGRIDDALGAAERYRTARPEQGDGWALLGDVRTAKKNYQAAETAFQEALEVEPDNRLYAFKLGRTERALGKTQAAADRLRASGPPENFEDDWTLEYGEALYTLHQVQDLQVHIQPWADAHPTNAQGQFLYGYTLYEAGEEAAAVDHLAMAHDGGDARAKAPLIDALDALGVAAVAKNDLANAEALLTRADAVGGDVLTWRNLGAVLIAQGEPDRALVVLKKAVEADKKDPVAQHLLARAYQGLKRYDDARSAYGKAIKAYGKDARVVSAQLDLANAELGAGRGEQAVDALENAMGGASDAPTKSMLAKALVDAARASSTDDMRSGRFGAAVKMLKRIEKRVDDASANDVRCDLALAHTGNGSHVPALEILKKLEKSKVKCPFVAPADELAVPILIAWNEGASLKKAKKALQRLEALRKKASGVAEPLARLAGRDIALRAAQEAYEGGSVKSAASYLSDARLYDKRSPELAHNEAVVDLANGKLDDAIDGFEKIADDVPEAYVHLGIAWEKKGDAIKALEYWRTAKSKGAHWSKLDDWIETKERFWGGGQ